VHWVHALSPLLKLGVAAAAAAAVLLLLLVVLLLLLLLLLLLRSRRLLLAGQPIRSAVCIHPNRICVYPKPRSLVSWGNESAGLQSLPRNVREEAWVAWCCSECLMDVVGRVCVLVSYVSLW
jgi:hypothetical protein